MEEGEQVAIISRDRGLRAYRVAKGHLVFLEDILQETNKCLDVISRNPLPLSNPNRDGTVWSLQTVVLEHILKPFLLRVPRLPRPFRQSFP